MKVERQYVQFCLKGYVTQDADEIDNLHSNNYGTSDSDQSGDNRIYIPLAALGPTGRFRTVPNRPTDLDHVTAPPRILAGEKRPKYPGHGCPGKALQKPLQKTDSLLSVSSNASTATANLSQSSNDSAPNPKPWAPTATVPKPFVLNTPTKNRAKDRVTRRAGSSTKKVRSSQGKKKKQQHKRARQRKSRGGTSVD